MTARNSFLVILRIIFVVSAIKFINDAFFLWDGYSFRMHFSDFLPDLSLTFVLWSITASIFAIILWIALYILFKICKMFMQFIRFEHVIVWFFIAASLLIVISNINLVSHLFTGLRLWARGLIVLLLVTVIVWIGHKWLEKIQQKVNASITPLVWIFTILFLMALPLSFYKQSSAEENITPDTSVTHYDFNKGESRPNIILVIMDALSAKNMSLYGYDVPTTPFITEWAKNAIVFKNVYSTTNWTTPAVMSIMTGQRPWTHRTWYEPNFLPMDRNYENNMPKILRNQGYEVNCYVQNEYAHPFTLGIDKSFMRKDNSHTFSKSGEFWFYRLQDKLKNRPIASKWLFQQNFIAQKILKHAPEEYVTLTPSEKVYNRFMDDIKINSLNKRGRPFFAWLHTFPPHDPYLPPAPYMGVFGDKEKFNTQRKQLESGILYQEYDSKLQSDVDILKKRYDEYIIYSDKQFEFFISHLNELVDMSNTIVIFTADHGESFSHGYQAHDGTHLFESLVRVPLVIKMPDKEKGTVIETTVEITDIAPTILDLAGMSIPDWMEGRSLLPLINGKIDSRPVFSMQLIRNRSIGNNPITKGTFAVRDGDYKLIYYMEDNKILLFNLLNDSDETLDIVNNHPKIAQALLNLIKDNLENANKKIMQNTREN